MGSGGGPASADEGGSSLNHTARNPNPGASIRSWALAGDAGRPWLKPVIPPLPLPETLKEPMPVADGAMRRGLTAGEPEHGADGLTPAEGSRKGYMTPSAFFARKAWRTEGFEGLPSARPSPQPSPRSSLSPTHMRQVMPEAKHPAQTGVPTATATEVGNVGVNPNPSHDRTAAQQQGQRRASLAQADSGASTVGGTNSEMGTDPDPIHHTAAAPRLTQAGESAVPDASGELFFDAESWQPGLLGLRARSGSAETDFASATSRALSGGLEPQALPPTEGAALLEGITFTSNSVTDNAAARAAPGGRQPEAEGPRATTAPALAAPEQKSAFAALASAPVAFSDDDSDVEGADEAAPDVDAAPDIDTEAATRSGAHAVQRAVARGAPGLSELPAEQEFLNTRCSPGSTDDLIGGRVGAAQQTGAQLERPVPGVEPVADGETVPAVNGVGQRSPEVGAEQGALGAAGSGGLVGSGKALSGGPIAGLPSGGVAAGWGAWRVRPRATSEGPKTKRNPGPGTSDDAAPGGGGAASQLWRVLGLGQGSSPEPRPAAAPQAPGGVGGAAAAAALGAEHEQGGPEGSGLGLGPAGCAPGPEKCGDLAEGGPDGVHLGVAKGAGTQEDPDHGFASGSGARSVPDQAPVVTQAGKALCDARASALANAVSMGGSLRLPPGRTLTLRV